MSLSRLVPLAIVLCLLAGVANAGDLLITGTFTQDDQLQVFLFSAPSASVLLRTWSYAGGTITGTGGPLDGTVIAAGGFDPVLTLFDATYGFGPLNPYVADNNDGAGVDPDPVNGYSFDSLLFLTGLDMGHTYALVLSQNDNTHKGTSYGDGFSQAGQGNFTSTEFGCNDGAPFCQGPFQANLDGHWAVEISGVGGVASAPEPGSALLLAAGAAALALLRRRRKHSH